MEYYCIVSFHASWVCHVTINLQIIWQKINNPIETIWRESANEAGPLQNGPSHKVTHTTTPLFSKYPHKVWLLDWRNLSWLTLSKETEKFWPLLHPLMYDWIEPKNRKLKIDILVENIMQITHSKVNNLQYALFVWELKYKYETLNNNNRIHFVFAINRKTKISYTVGTV